MKNAANGGICVKKQLYLAEAWLAQESPIWCLLRRETCDDLDVKSTKVKVHVVSEVVRTYSKRCNYILLQTITFLLDHEIVQFSYKPNYGRP